MRSNKVGIRVYMSGQGEGDGDGDGDGLRVRGFHMSEGRVPETARYPCRELNQSTCISGVGVRGATHYLHLHHRSCAIRVPVPVPVQLSCMARFYPLYVRRSDGRTEIVSKSKRREPNKPTDEQLDQKPDKNGTSDYYREVGIDESKHLDWRRKLGGMLARELDWKDKAAQADAGTKLPIWCEVQH